jgi:hypothetical protein
MEKANGKGSDPGLEKFTKGTFGRLQIDGAEYGTVRGQAFVDFNDAMVKRNAFANR